MACLFSVCFCELNYTLSRSLRKDTVSSDEAAIINAILMQSIREVHFRKYCTPLNRNCLSPGNLYIRQGPSYQGNDAKGLFLYRIFTAN